MNEACAFVLAGGRSSRMGQDKAFLLFEGSTLLERTLATARAVVPEARIVGSVKKFQSFAETVEDQFPDHGPLGGIHAALRASRCDRNIILAVDMPFLEPAWLAYLLEQSRTSNAVVTLPRGERGWQPLCAVYRPEFADLAEPALRAGRNRIDSLFAQISPRVIDERELADHDFSPDMFRNLNTPEEFERAALVEKNWPHAMASDAPNPLSPPNSPYIDFRHVSKAFGERHVLDDVNFDVRAGETVCILGRSGVGKSVSLHHIMGFLKPDSGRVIVAYEDITDFTDEQMEHVRKKVTMVFQNGALFDSLTVGENIAFPLRERGDLSEDQIFQIIDGLLEMVGVAHMRDLLPSDLSTGMKRSVAIARALAAQPECVLYDEPTTMVDPLMAQLLGDLIKRLKIQLHLTSVVVTHDMRLAKKLADRIVFLHEAKAIFFGTYAEMAKSDHPIIQEFLELDTLTIEA